jgi:hypothetical protein
MTTRNASTVTPLRTALALGLVAVLAACSPSERQEVRKDTAQAADSAGKAASNAASSAAASAEKAVESAGKAIDDAGITAKVKSAMLADDQVKGLQINVDTSAGAVTLTGSAQTDAEKQRAEQLVAGVEGVRSVQNNIAVAAAAGATAKGTAAGSKAAGSDATKPAAKSDRAKGGC